jgi:hypothetical protein
MSLALIEWNMLFQVHEHFIDEVCILLIVGGAANDKRNAKEIKILSMNHERGREGER